MGYLKSSMRVKEGGMTSDTNRKCLCTSSDLHAVNATGQEPIRVAQIVGKMVGGGVESVVMNYYRHIDRTKCSSISLSMRIPRAFQKRKSPL